ncbi:MAG: anti-sigma factor antagonist [Selenomonadaceae bacterium]|nr:anti-sigma factor antagonist [Selenomonadaceae bacterium]
MIDFKDFDFDDNERYMDYLRRCIQIPSNASPTILLAGRESGKTQRAYVDNLCWHRFFADGAEFWGPPLGEWDEIDWKKIFAKHVPAETTFMFVPEYLVKLWQRALGDAIQIDDDRDMWDYILYLDRLEKLTGKKLKRIRNAKNSFEKNYEYEIEDITPEIFNELWQFHVGAEKNLQERVESVDLAQADSDHFLFALNHWDELKNLFGFVIRVDEKIVAYSVDELIDETHSIGLFAKADYNFSGVNEFAYWNDAKISLERGILTQNFMDDVGEENLRFFKEHLCPLVMLKKFYVTYNPTEDFCDVKISSQRDGDNLTLKLSGKLNTDSANAAKNEILSALDGVKTLTFDLNKLEYISSAGLRILIAAMKKIKAQGGTMTVKNVGAQVREVLEMTGFAEIFNLSWRPNI